LRRLDRKRGKRRQLVSVAIARHLAGFCWAILTLDPRATVSDAIASDKPEPTPAVTSTPDRPNTGAHTDFTPQDFDRHQMFDPFHTTRLRRRQDQPGHRKREGIRDLGSNCPGSNARF
jgi:hypothetical protein